MDHQNKTSTFVGVLFFCYILRRFELVPCATVCRKAEEHGIIIGLMRQHSCRISDGSPKQDIYFCGCLVFLFRFEEIRTPCHVRRFAVRQIYCYVFSIVSIFTKINDYICSSKLHVLFTFCLICSVCNEGIKAKVN